MNGICKLNGWVIHDLSYVTRGWDKTEVQKYLLKKSLQNIGITNFLGDWEIRIYDLSNTLVTTHRVFTKTETNRIIANYGCPSIKEIEDLFEPSDFCDPIQYIK